MGPPEEILHISRTVEFTVPGNPTGKGRPRFSRKSGVAFTPKKTATVEGIITTLAIDAMATAGLLPFTGPCKMKVVAYFPISASWSKKKRSDALAGVIRPTGKPDGDNVLKLVSDALNTIVFGDDSQVVDARVIKLYAEQPRTVVIVGEA